MFFLKLCFDSYLRQTAKCELCYKVVIEIEIFVHSIASRIKVVLTDTHCIWDLKITKIIGVILWKKMDKQKSFQTMSRWRFWYAKTSMTNYFKSLFSLLHVLGQLALFSVAFMKNLLRMRSLCHIWLQYIF